LDILIYLADRLGEVIAKQELIDRVWSDITVEEGNLRVHAAAIREALFQFTLPANGEEVS